MTDITVFSVLRESECSECGTTIMRGQLLRLEDRKPLCMACADLDHLYILPSGNAALTRRAGKYSSLRAVIVRFSRARKRYERQGLLVEEAALQRAEQECLADADARARARERAAIRRAEEDDAYIAAFAERIGELYPGCPPPERRQIAGHTCRRSSGRVGRSASARQLEESAVDLAVRAHFRHAHTSYDELLVEGMDRDAARARIAADVEDGLRTWRDP